MEHSRSAYDVQRSDLLTVDQVAQRLGLHTQTVRRLIRSGVLPSVRLGFGPKARYRVDAAELDEWLYRDEEQS